MTANRALESLKRDEYVAKLVEDHGYSRGWNDAIDACIAVLSAEEIEGLDEAIDGVAEYQQLRQRCGFTKKITQHISVVLEAARRYAALPHCPDGFVCVPREPTEEILTAALFQGKWPTRESFDNFYALLIAAAEGNK